MMVDFSYQWQGLEDALRRVQALAGLHGLESELEATGDDIVQAAQDYPPERPGQRYARQYILRNTWHRGDPQRAGSTIAVDVTNPTAYGPFVMGEDQAEVHRGRWKRLRVIGQEQRGAIRARAQSWALRVWRGG